MLPCCRGEPDRTGNLLLSPSQTAFARAMVGMVQLLEEVPAQREQGPDADDAEEDPEIFSQAKRQKVCGSSTWRWLRLCDERPRNASTGQAAECKCMGAALWGEEWQLCLLSCEKWFARWTHNCSGSHLLGIGVGLVDDCIG